MPGARISRADKMEDPYFHGIYGLGKEVKKRNHRETKKMSVTNHSHCYEGNTGSTESVAKVGGGQFGEGGQWLQGETPFSEKLTLLPPRAGRCHFEPSVYCIPSLLLC